MVRETVRNIMRDQLDTRPLKRTNSNAFGGVVVFVIVWLCRLPRCCSLWKLVVVLLR
jgi:hypothetical protein